MQDDIKVVRDSLGDSVPARAVAGRPMMPEEEGYDKTSEWAQRATAFVLDHVCLFIYVNVCLP